MARRSKKSTMKAISVLLFLIAVALTLAAVINIDHRDFLTGLQLIGCMLVILALLLGFTMPTKCKVRTARGGACKNNSYGFLFGCSPAASHWSGKFRARLGWQGDMEKPVGKSQSESSHEAMHYLAGQSQTVKVKIEDSKLSTCASWAGIVSAITGIAAIVIPIFAH